MSYLENLICCCKNDSRVYRAFKQMRDSIAAGFVQGPSGAAFDAITLVQIEVDDQYDSRPPEAGKLAPRRKAFDALWDYFNQVG